METFLLRVRTSWRTALAKEMGSPDVRTTRSASGHTDWPNGSMNSGRGGASSPAVFVSPTMPTISIQLGGSPRAFLKLIRCPTGLAPCQYRCDIVSLTMTTCGDDALSELENKRPERSGMNIVSKYPGVTTRGSAVISNSSCGRS